MMVDVLYKASRLFLLCLRFVLCVALIKLQKHCSNILVVKALS